MLNTIDRFCQMIRLFFIFLSLGLVTCSSSAQVDPEIHWKVMRLPHFDLMYDAKHQDLANLYADRLENNLVFLREYFDSFPERTVVVLNDRTDLTNGYATPIPYRTIVIYPVLPGPQETISDFGDWARELTLHEYTHILSFEPRRGIVQGLYYTFGNIVTPNILLPRWWLEGIAVDLETRTSQKGRLRSPYQDAAIRAYVKEHQLRNLKLPEISETTIHTWPQGGRPYLFGSLMWSELIANHGKKLISELHRRYGGRMPYLIDGPVRDETGKSYAHLFEEMKIQLESKAKQQIATLEKVPFTDGTTLTIKNGVENFNPVISPDGLKMILLSKNDANKRSVRILKRPSTSVVFDGTQEWAEIDQRIGESLQELNPDPRRIQYGLDENSHDGDAPPGGTIHRLAWFMDSKRFVFDKIDTVNRFHDVSDLYIFDLTKMKIERLTRNERAREAAISPDEKDVVFVKLGAGRTDLAIYNLEKKKTEIIYSPPLQVRISAPSYLSVDEIIFSERDDQGREILKKYSLTSKQTQEILPEYVDARFPKVTPQGLIFTSYINGTGNVYLASSDLSSARPLTHSATLISSSSLDPARNELYVTELTTNGFQISYAPLAASSNLPPKLPKISPLLEDRYPLVKSDIPNLEKPTPEEYSIWPYILPHYWLPNFYFSNDRSVLGGSIAGSDPLAKHSYSLAASYDTKPKEISYSFLYANNQTKATLLAKALDYRTTLINRGFEFRQQLYEIDALWEITPVSTDLYAGFGYSYLGRRFKNSHTESMGPSLIANYSDISMSGAQISPESGQIFSLSATEYTSNSEDSGEEFYLYQLSLQKYFSKWLPRHHAIMMRAQGQYIDKPVNSPNNAFTLAYNPFANSPIPVYVMRGYLDGQFSGKSLANYTLEYRFPIYYPYFGTGTVPVFLKKVHGALITDGITLDGESYNQQTKSYESVEKWKSFWSSGAELKLDLTLGYHFPLTLFMGYYFPHDSKYRDGEQFVFGFQL